MQKTVTVLVENRPGVLTHVAGLISRRGFNIESIAASSTEASDVTRISIVVDVENNREYQQIMDQLGKLIRVIKVLDMDAGDSLFREMALIKIKSAADARQEIISMVDIFKARIIDMSVDYMIVEMTDESAKVDTFCQIMEKYGIIEIIRTGEIFLSRKSVAALEENE